MKKNYFLLPLEIRIRIQELCGSTQNGSERKNRHRLQLQNTGCGSSYLGAVAVNALAMCAVAAGNFAKTAAVVCTCRVLCTQKLLVLLTCVLLLFMQRQFY